MPDEGKKESLSLYSLPGQHEVCTGVVGPGAGGAPLDGVDFFTVGLKVMDT